MWEDVPLIGRNGIIKGFLVNYTYVDQESGELGESIVLDVNNSTYGINISNTDDSNTTYNIHITNLTRDSYYNISVAAYTDVGVGLYSVPEYIETGPYGVYFKMGLDFWMGALFTSLQPSTNQDS